MIDGSPSGARRFVAATGLHAPVVLGSDELRARFRVVAYPWTIVIGRNGQAVAAVRGARSEDKFRTLFEKYL